MYLITQTVANAMGKVLGMRSDFLGDSETRTPRPGCTDTNSIMDNNQVLLEI